MPISTTPPALPPRDNTASNPPRPPISPAPQGENRLPAAPRVGGLSIAPAKIGDHAPLKPHAPEPATNRDLDEEYATATLGIDAVKEFVFNETLINSNKYETHGSLTAEEVIAKDYNTNYKRLEGVVVEVLGWLREIISDQDRNQDIADARKHRNGPKYKEMKTLLDQLLVRHFSQDKVVSPADTSIVSAIVVNELLGLGPLEPLWGDKRITEIMVNGPHKVRIEIGGKLITAKGVKFRDQEHLLDTCQQLLAPLNRTIDIAHPLEDGRLPDGSRINVTHPAVGPAGPYLTIRRFPETVFSIKRLVDGGSMTEEIATEIGNLIHAGCSTVIAGGTGSGKTSMLNALSGCIPESERVITIEDNLELRLHPDRDVVALETRRSHQGDSGRGNVSIRDLVKNSLRMRPDRIVVGEVRDGSAYDMLQAMNTGHEGSMTTVHANDAHGALDRLVNLISEVGEVDARQAISLISNGVDLIVSIRRFEDGSRRVETIAEIPTRVNIDGQGNSSLEPRLLWEFVQTGLGENDTVIGEYRRVNEISESLTKKHRLDKKRQLTMGEIYELSNQEPIVTN